jgi:hypothetical protein
MASGNPEMRAEPHRLAIPLPTARIFQNGLQSRLMT